MTVCSDCSHEIHPSQGADHMGAAVRHRHREDCFRAIRGDEHPSEDAAIHKAEQRVLVAASKHRFGHMSTSALQEAIRDLGALGWKES